MFKKNHKPFDKYFVKLAEIRLEENNVFRWKDEIHEAISDRYPWLIDGMTEVKFNNIDESAGDATGRIEYNDGKMRMTIPIFISENDMKNPDIAIWENKVIPLDRKFIEWLSEDGENAGKMYGDTEDAADFGSHSYVFNKESSIDPELKKMALENIEKTIIPAEFEDIVKKALKKEPEEKIVACREVEKSNKPYHYDVGILKKIGAEFKYEVKEVNQEELNKIARGIDATECTNGIEAEPLTIESVKIKKMKPLTETGECSVMFGSGYKERADVVKPSTILGEKNRNKVIVFASEHEGEKRKEIWAYGKAYGVSQKDRNGEVSPYLKRVWGVKAADGEATGHVIFGNGHKVSHPYKVEKTETFKVGPDRSHEYTVYTLKQVDEPRIINVVLGTTVTDVEKADTSKLSEIDLGVVANGYPTYMLPGVYKAYKLGERVTLPDPLDVAEQEIKKVAEENYGSTLYLDRNHGDSYNITVEGKGYKDWNKTASLMLANTLTGFDHTDIEEYEINCEYDIPKQAKERKIDLTPLDKKREELIRLASYLQKNAGDIEKKADVESLVENLIGVSIESSDNIDSIREIIGDVVNVLHHIGQLIMLKRLSNTRLDEGVLVQSMRAITKLVNELRGVRTG